MKISSQINLQDKDLYLMEIEKKIQEKNDLLINKYKTLCEISKDNEYLNTIKNDYNKYYEFIINEKLEQIKHMEFIHNYIQYIIKENKLTDKDINEAKNHQKEIFDEINKIKYKLDNLVNNLLNNK